MADEITVASIPDAQLVQRAIWTCRPTRTNPLWVLVMDRFALGSTFSRQLCRAHGLNPDARNRDQMEHKEPQA